ncbi:hypothetical protein MEP402_gp26 [Methylophilales phage MEP402]|jgi:hypothetical protein|nr:hypothetical protein MEP402_gp26 [Methylophilales phage MEP402]
MALSYKEVCEELSKLDETTLLEVLDITSEDLVNKFQDKIEDNLEELSNDLEEHTKQLDFTFNEEE